MIRKLELSLHEIIEWMSTANWLLLWFLSGVIIWFLFNRMVSHKEAKGGFLLITLLFPPIGFLLIVASWIDGKYGNNL